MPRGKRSAAWRGGPSWSIAAASILQLAVLTWPLMSQAADSETPRQTFSIDYIVTIPHAGATTAQVRWELAGIEEIERLTLRFPDTGASEITGSGQLVRHDNHVVWTPSKPYAHLSYTIELNHVRGTQHRFDSYATDSWIVTRARQLFPIIHMEAKERNGVTPKSRARLIFRLPKGWQSIAALPKEAPDVFRLADPAQILDRPFGWYVLGHFTVDRQEIAGIMVSIARVPGVGQVKVLGAGSYSMRDTDKWSLAAFPTYPAKFIRPPMIEDALLNVECRLVSTQPLGDHTVFTGEALWARYEPDKQPLIYHQGKYWHLGEQVPKE